MSGAWPFRVPRNAVALFYAPWALLVVLPWLVATTAAGAVLVFLLSFVGNDLGMWVGVQWSRALAAVNFTRVSLRGADRAPRGRACVIVCNHQSHFDVLALLSRWRHPYRFVMKEELRRVPFLGWGCGILGMVFLDRSNRERAIASLQAARPLLDRGVSILFFAEGTRSRDGRMRPFKKGAFALALDAGMPILPVSVSGGHRVLPGRSFVLLPGHMTVTIHEPVPTAGLSVEDRDALMERVRATIATGLTPWERGEVPAPDPTPL